MTTPRITIRPPDVPMYEPATTQEGIQNIIDICSNPQIYPELMPIPDTEAYEYKRVLKPHWIALSILCSACTLYVYTQTRLYTLAAGLGMTILVCAFKIYSKDSVKTERAQKQEDLVRKIFNHAIDDFNTAASLIAQVISTQISNKHFDRIEVANNRATTTLEGLKLKLNSQQDQVQIKVDYQAFQERLNQWLRFFNTIWREAINVEPLFTNDLLNNSENICDSFKEKAQEFRAASSRLLYGKFPSPENGVYVNNQLEKTFVVSKPWD